MRKIVLFFFLITCISAFAQRQWSLEECIEYAVAHNISVKQLEIQRAAAEITLNTSKMSRLPDLNASAGQNFSFGRSTLGDNISQQVNSAQSSLGVQTSVPLFTGFRIPNEIARDRIDLQAATQSLERAKDDISLNVAMLFLQVLFNEELLKISNEQIALTQEQLAKTQALVDAGKVPSAQLADVRAQLANDRVSVVQAENNVKNALLDLAQSLELDNFTDFDIRVPNLENPVEIHQNAEQVYATALHIKPAIKEQELRIESAQKTLKIAQSGYFPTLNLSAGISNNYFYSYGLGINPQTGEQLKNALFSQQIKDNLSEYVALSLNIPIFSRFQTRNNVKNSRLNIENQQFILETAKKSLFKEIQTAYLNATAAQEKFRAAETATDATSEAFQLAQDKYSTGKSTAFELNEARTRWLRNRSDAVQAKYDYIFRSKILDFYEGKKLSL
ncbi:MAG: TolC family protein [Prevotellaceae bacterium]|jgi:outer membrane protein|nr:TolC family protein [Prevotellaceae bacterium]